MAITVSAATGKQTVEVTEDTGTVKTVEVTPETPHESIVGNVLIRAENLCFSASGKEDVSSLKRSIEQAQRETRILLDRFGVVDELAFDALAGEQVRLESELTVRQTALVRVLKGETIDALQLKMKQLQKARR